VALKVWHRARRYDTAFCAAQAAHVHHAVGIALQYCRSEGLDLAAHPNCASVIAADAQSQTHGRSRRAAKRQVAAAE
jgi:hypothetical protein